MQTQMITPMHTQLPKTNMLTDMNTYTQTHQTTDSSAYNNDLTYIDKVVLTHTIIPLTPLLSIGLRNKFQWNFN